MRAARCESYGGPEAVVVRNVPEPRLRPGHVLVDVAAAAVNFPDLLILANRYQISVPVPFTIGSEFAGRVAEVAEDVTGFMVGDAVWGASMSGAMAERISMPAQQLAKVPAGLPLVDAAAFRVSYLTAYHSLVTAGGLRPGEWVAVLGAAGGVGSAAVDVASRLGARVIAAASSPERLEACRVYGAQAGIDYSREDLKLRLKEITGEGVDLVIDPVGDRWAESALRGVRWGGRFVCVGFAGGQIPRIPLNLALLKNVTIRGMELRSWMQRMPDAVALAEQELDRLIEAGMRPHVGASYPLDDVTSALRCVADRAAVGKVVVTI